MLMQSNDSYKRTLRFMPSLGNFSHVLWHAFHQNRFISRRNNAALFRNSPGVTFLGCRARLWVLMRVLHQVCRCGCKYIRAWGRRQNRIIASHRRPSFTRSVHHSLCCALTLVFASSTTLSFIKYPDFRSSNISTFACRLRSRIKSPT